MTNPSSYAFDCNRDDMPLHLMGEPSLILRLSVSDDRISIRLNRVITDDSGVISEELAEGRVMTLHVNASGEKYVRAVEIDGDGAESEWPFDVSRKWVVSKIGLTDEATALINNAIGEWLGIKDGGYFLGRNGPWAFYPALRSLSIWKKINSRDWHAERTMMTLMAYLSMVASRTGRIREALRGNSDWRSFVGDITKESSGDSDELTLVSKRILEEPSLLEFAMLDTEIPFSKLWRDEKEAMQAYADSFITFNKQAIHLMFEFLPTDAKAEAVQLLLMMLGEWNKVRPRHNKYREGVFAFSDAFARVPEELKSTLALEFFEHLRKSSSTIRTDLAEYNKTPTKFLPANFASVYSEWFYEFVFQPSIVSDASAADVVELHNTLFGVDVCSELEFYETNQQTTFCHLKWRFDTVQDAVPPLIFANLAPLVYAFPESKENNSTPNNEYVDAEGYQGIMPSGSLYSPDDMVTVLKLGAETIDRALYKLGREATPENRYSYLTMCDPDRNYESTWLYYDLGVTDPHKIAALKKADITDVDEILTYAQLPDKMFYEFIALLNH